MKNKNYSFHLFQTELIKNECFEMNSVTDENRIGKKIPSNGSSATYNGICVCVS